MKLSMDLEQAIGAASSALRAGLTVQVTPCTYNPNEYRVKADGIDLVPTEHANQVKGDDYSLRWGRRADGQYYVNYKHGILYEGEIVQDEPIEMSAALRMERDLCNTHDLPIAYLYSRLDWTPWPTGAGGEFHKAACVPEPTDQYVRTCHFGCGRVLRDHERRCPDCVPSYDELYNTGGGC